MRTPTWGDAAAPRSAGWGTRKSTVMTYIFFWLGPGTGWQAPLLGGDAHSAGRAAC